VESSVFFARVVATRRLSQILAREYKRDPDGQFSSGSGGGSYAATYGTVLDEASAGGDDEFVVAVTETSDMHLAYDDPGGTSVEDRVVVAELTPEVARALADELDWAHSYEITGDEPEDDDGMIDSTGVQGRDDLLVMVYSSGDVGVRNTGSDDPGPASGFDMGNDDAADLALALNDMADFYDAEFG